MQKYLPTAEYDYIRRRVHIKVVQMDESVSLPDGVAAFDTYDEADRHLRRRPSTAPEYLDD